MIPSIIMLGGLCYVAVAVYVHICSQGPCTSCCCIRQLLAASKPCWSGIIWPSVGYCLLNLMTCTWSRLPHGSDASNQPSGCSCAGSWGRWAGSAAELDAHVSFRPRIILSMRVQYIQVVCVHRGGVLCCGDMLLVSCHTRLQEISSAHRHHDQLVVR
jgi:hypothetical protein